MTDDAGAVGAGLLDPDPLELTEAAHPAQQRPVAGAGGREGVGADYRAGLVDERGHMQILVGVDAAEHRALKA